MATVSVQLWAGARAAAGVDSEIVEAVSVAAAVDLVADRHPGLRRVLAACSILVDGTVVHPRDLAEPLTGPVRVEVLPPFAGG